MKPPLVSVWCYQFSSNLKIGRRASGLGARASSVGERDFHSFFVRDSAGCLARKPRATPELHKFLIGSVGLEMNKSFKELAF
jgi:hypothetical protein